MFAVASKEKAIDIYTRCSSGQGNSSFRRCAVLKGHAVRKGCSRVSFSSITFRITARVLNLQCFTGCGLHVQATGCAHTLINNRAHLYVVYVIRF
jgi:hypothetical protein